MSASSFIVLPPLNLPTIDKTEGATLEYSIELVDWLAGDSISTWDAVVSGGITRVSKTKTGTVLTAVVSGGTAGTSAAITYSFTTGTGRVELRTVVLRIVAQR